MLKDENTVWLIFVTLLVIGGVLITKLGTANLSNKYHNAIMYSAQALQRRLYSICEQDGYIELTLTGTNEEKEDLIQYTCWLFARYLSWVHIYRRSLEFAGPPPRNDTGKPRGWLGTLFMGTLGTPSHADALDAPCRFLPSFTQAIEELMISSEHNDLRPMSWTSFHTKWAQDESFRHWFAPLETGLLLIARKKHDHREAAPDHRLRKLQHILVSAVHIWDPDGGELHRDHKKLCTAAPGCECHSTECIKARDKK
ncbi:hypothetical protein B9Z65_660 [Elsinoe australis]|uniref:Uncharacterized protein n=1 Tax=Elsinoe australis TaxID=40998 RepID=A0A2P8AJ63_9PEZI|nr:hypothetical protein B9Z65_660 [Elsinoe australis]